MRGLRRRNAEREFRVDLHVIRLNDVPATHRMLYVQWRMSRRDAGAPHHGMTKSRPVEVGNFVEWDEQFQILARIAADPADSDGITLQSTNLRLELRSERRSRIGIPSYNAEGFVEIDLAEVAETRILDRNFLVQEALVNATLRVTVQMEQTSGDTVFRGRGAALASALDPAVSVDGLLALPAPPRAVRRNESFSRLSGLETVPSLVAPLGARARSGALSAVGAVGAAAAAGRGATLKPLPSASSSSLFTTRTGDGSPASEQGGGGVCLEGSSRNLEGYAPDSNEVQAEVYEQIFWQRIRDDWPEKVTASRTDPVAAVEDILADVVHALPRIDSRRTSSAGSESSIRTKMDESKMTVESLLDSLYAPAPRGPSRAWRFGDPQPLDEIPRESVDKRSALS